MFIYTHTFIYLYICGVFIYIHIYLFEYICGLCLYIYIYTFIYLYICGVFIYIYIHIYLFVYLWFVCVCVCVCVCVISNLQDKYLTTDATFYYSYFNKLLRVYLYEKEVERALQVLGVRRWRELVAGRKKWKDIIQQAKADSGL